MKTPLISRRTMLKGVGGVAVGLPLLDEMASSPALAAPKPAIPVRAFNVFFGLGIPAPLQEEGFAGVLEPLKPLSKKLLLLRNVDHVRCDEPGINAHWDGSAAAFTAAPPNGTARAGGPSLDQLVRAAHYPKGLPPEIVPALIAGTYFRRNDRIVRYVHSFHEDGSPAGKMQEQPRDLFERVFGTVPLPDNPDPRRLRQRRSVLDSVMAQYRYYTGANSPLGTASKARVADHLERIREYEQRALATGRKTVKKPAIPDKSRLLHGGEADPGGEGIDLRLEDLVAEWRLMADLYALAIQCDRARFGSLTFLAAGERIRLKGKYDYAGKTIFEFDDGRHRSTSGAMGCSHEWWHEFNEKNKNEQLRAHAHLKLREVAYFLGRLDGPDSLEPNGKTILENSLITISTESGDGRHDSAKRELSGVFHAITGANGRFKAGQIVDARAEGLDVYNTMLAAMGAAGRLGPTDRTPRAIDSIRA